MSQNENVVDRTPDLPASLDEVAASILQEVRGGDSGHAAVTLTPSTDGAIKQTVVGLRAGGTLGPQRWNGPATLQVLTGAATVAGQRVEAGRWTVIEGDGTDVTADDDTALLLTVAPHPGD